MRTGTWMGAAVAAIGLACVATSRLQPANDQEPGTGEAPRVHQGEDCPALLENCRCRAEQPAEPREPEHNCEWAPEDGEGEPVPSPWTFAVEPKPLTGNVERGIAWLLSTQLASGAWGQGEEAAQMRGGNTQLRDQGSVADTCVAALALLRAGGHPLEGPYADALSRALDFVCGQIEASDEESLYVTELRGTRVQSKIGTYVDTFMSSLLLSESLQGLGDGETSRRLRAAQEKVLAKIERNQAANGTWDGQGWAPVLSQSMAGKALHRARQMRFEVGQSVIDGNDAYFLGAGDSAAMSPAGAGTAGVALYGGAASLGALQESFNSSIARESELRAVLANSTDEDEIREIKLSLGRIEAGRKAQGDVQARMLDRLDDPAFVAGFGSNGGEEFLSYLNISESLVVRADDEWRTWDGNITVNLSRIQNQDGSWSGHHCITGRTFCTSTALLVLLADRTPVPVELVAARGK